MGKSLPSKPQFPFLYNGGPNVHMSGPQPADHLVLPFLFGSACLVSSSVPCLGWALSLVPSPISQLPCSHLSNLLAAFWDTFLTMALPCSTSGAPHQDLSPG